jgi:uncharacterized YccA/Bax inhibitor family protein
MRSANPALKQFQQPQTWDQLDAAARGVGGGAEVGRPNVMTLSGTVNASLILVSLCAAAGMGTWMFLQSQPALSWPLALGGMIVGLILALAISFGPRTAPFLSPVYALAQGVFVGGLSMIVAARLGGAAGPATGIIFQALLLTFGILFSLLFAYRAGLVRVGSTMKKCMFAALGGVMFMYIAGIVLLMLGFNVPLFHEFFAFGQVGLIGIGFSVVMVVLASLFLVWDFQTIEEGVAAGAPKYMEWYGGFSLLVTLVWLYVEVLRLLAKLKSE